jgi:hypothetical protein
MMLSVSFYWNCYLCHIVEKKYVFSKIKFKIANLGIQLKTSSVQVRGLTIILEALLRYKGNYIY